MCVKPAAQRRVVGNTALSGVCFLRTDYLECLLKAVLDIAHPDNTAQSNGILRRVSVDIIDYLRVLNEGFQFCDLGIELTLLGLCFVVFAVFGQVAEAPRLFYKLRNLFFPDGFKVVELILDGVQTLLAHFKSVGISHNHYDLLLTS